MLEVRCDLEDDVQEIADGVRELVDWKAYVKRYPWICLGTAFVLGYAIVPRRRSQWNSIQFANAQALANGKPLMRVSLQPQYRIRDAAVSFVGNLLLRGVSTFVSNQTEKILANYAEKSRERESP